MLGETSAMEVNKKILLLMGEKNQISASVIAVRRLCTDITLVLKTGWTLKAVGYGS